MTRALAAAADRLCMSTVKHMLRCKTECLHGQLVVPAGHHPTGCVPSATGRRALA